MIANTSLPARFTIHTPREGRDKSVAIGVIHLASVSIHAPHKGRDYNIAIIHEQGAIWRKFALCSEFVASRERK